MKINLVRTQEGLFALSIFLTPLFSLFEVIALFNNNSRGNQTALTPFYIKGIKDLLLLLVMACGFVMIVKKRKLPFFPGYFCIVTLALISSFGLVVFQSNPILALSGLRWLTPVIFMFFAGELATESNHAKLAKVLFFIYALHFILQLTSFFFFKNIYGTGAFGFSIRNPGVFLIPSTAAFFSLTACFYNIFFDPESRSARFCRFTLPVSVVLTGSGTGIVAYAVYLLIVVFFKFRQKGLILLVSLATLLALLAGLPWVSGRGQIYTSLLERFFIFSDSISDVPIFNFGQFGLGTNTGVLFAHSAIGGKGYIADSMFTSVIMNLGLAGLLLLAFDLLRAFSMERKAVVFFSTFFMFFITSVLFESFPMNYLFFVTFFYLLKCKCAVMTKDGLKAF